ncbi:ribonuclease P/MRP protein subunit POP5 isoform X2 [Brachyhypopomus gauderio]|uniref:ribonuclease P/MRP protein subunit POP5 isoform X2 n=1 Tax=Brachyhypopomus gauderio TaxID=698409 RepID=UPI004041912B
MVRIKNRYLLCEVCVSERNSLQLLTETAIYEAIKAAVIKAHGVYGAALYSIGSSVTYVNAYTGVVLLRLRKAHYRLLWSALPFVTRIWSRGQNLQCFFNCIHIGGKRASDLRGNARDCYRVHLHVHPSRGCALHVNPALFQQACMGPSEHARSFL